VRGFHDLLRQKPFLPVHIVVMELNLNQFHDNAFDVPGFGGG
jgi:hypothetical protein